MSKKKVLTMALVGLVLGFSALALAEVKITDTSGSGVGSALEKTINWIANVVGLGLVALGVVITGIRFAMHDPEALKKGMWVIIGGAIVFGAGKIVVLLKFFAR